jgi:hypothetical protein
MSLLALGAAAVGGESLVSNVIEVQYGDSPACGGVPGGIALVPLRVMLAPSATLRASCSLSLISAPVKALASALPWSLFFGRGSEHNLAS